MPFYIVVNGHINEHKFNYLLAHNGQRIEDTIVPGRKKVQKKIVGRDTYAIEIMSKNPTSIEPECSIKEALTIFKKKEIHHLPISTKSILKGLISDRDILWLEKFDLTLNNNVSSFMGKTILCCGEETPIEHLAEVMVKEKISAFPVILKDGKVVGIVTHHDLLKWIFEKP